MRPNLVPILFGRPGWVLPEAALDFDFVNDRYWVGGGVRPSSFISLTRASTALGQTVEGVWKSFASNVLRITNQGLLIEEARTNKCTNYNANPPALVTPTDAATFNAAVTNAVASGGDGNTLWGVVSDTSAISSAGLSNVSNGRAYKIDNSSGAATAFIAISGATGNTNAHTLSVFARANSSGSYSIMLLTGGSGTAQNVTTSYQRFSQQNTPGAGTDTMSLRAPAGAVVYFTLNQLEEGSFVTSPIIVAGASATRAADVPSLTGQAAAIALLAKSAFFQTNGSAGGTAPRLLDFNATQSISFNSTTSVQISNGTTSKAVTIGGGGTSAGTVKTAAGFDATSMSIVANGGTKDAAVGSWGTPSSSNLNIGNWNLGTRALNGYMQRFALSLTKGAFDSRTA